LAQQPSKRTRPLPGTLGAVLALLAAFLLVLPLALAPRAEAFIYWTSFSNKLGRANLDGTAINPSFITAPDPSGLAVNADHLYWPHFGDIGRANLDGTGVDPSLISTSPLPVGDVAVDADHIYWGSSGAIARANLDGTGVDRSFIADAGGGDIAVDAEHVYWSEGFCSPGPPCTWTIARADLDGTNVEQSFISDLLGAADHNEPFRVPTGLAVDEGHIYWGVLTGTYGRAIGRIGRANLDGTSVDRSFITGADHLADVAVGAGHVYWSHEVRFPRQTTGDEDPRIGRANLDGTGVDQAFVDFPRCSRVSCRGNIADGLAVDSLTDTKLAGRASAKKTQRQKGKKVLVKVKIKAKERLSAKASGKIKLSPTYKLKLKNVSLDAGETKTLKLKPKKAKAKKIAAALKRGEKAKARLTVKLTDLAGNRETETLRVRLKR
jgi:hypothetical protein